MDAIPATPLLADGAPVTLFLALELSRSTRLVALHSPLADKISQHRIGGGDTDSLLALIRRKQGQAEERLGHAVRVACCFEAGYDGLAASLAVHPWRREPGAGRGQPAGGPQARRAKTDRLDAAGLLRTLMALERGEAQVCRVVHVPSPEQEDARRRSRERALGGRARPAHEPHQGSADDAGHPRRRADPARLAGAVRGAAHGRRPAARALLAGRAAARVPQAAPGDGAR